MKKYIKRLKMRVLACYRIFTTKCFFCYTLGYDKDGAVCHVTEAILHDTKMGDVLDLLAYVAHCAQFNIEHLEAKN
ncbi:MAG: hypothetical protein K2F91_08300 [Muribaculaceae bacterium]|nr:hypothetical protein [Muribaculaceae bacterium]